MAGGEETSFGSLLRRWRRDAALSQEELAERAGMSARGIGDLERGARKTPYRATVLQLADALELEPSDRAALLEAAGRRPVSRLIRPGSLLPVPPTPLIGREREVAEVRAFLGQPEVRLVTLTGPGGVGKTRLALGVITEVEDLGMDTVHVVPLAPLRDPGLVAPAIGQALGVREDASQPLLESLVAHLRQQRVLLLLDNFEHLLEAAGPVAELLSACAQLKVLVTSRAPLHVHGEQEYPLAPLVTPGPQYVPPLQSLQRYPAVQLFVQRARAVQPAFRLDDANAVTVAEICYRLDGLPLAIELAAARIKVLAPQALLGRLDRRLQVLTGGARDLPARLQTLRDAIAWSYDLLDPAEQALFRRLSVFAGGFTAEAAEAVSQWVRGIELDTFEGLSSLVDESLLMVQPGSGKDPKPRFGMLETIREFAHEQLVASPEAEPVYREHARYFLTVAEEAQPALTGPCQAAWLERLEQEHDNLRAALRTAQQSDDVDLGVRLAAALWPFWLAHGHFKEAQRWLDAFLTHPNVAGASPSARACALCAAGELANEQHGAEVARSLLQQALLLAQQSGDDLCHATALLQLGRVALGHGEYEPAAQLLDESLAIYRRLGSQPGECAVLSNRAALARYQGDYQQAAALYEESQALGRAIGDVRSVADVVARLGQLEADQGRPAEALLHYEEALGLHRQLGNTFGIADALYRMGSAAADLADYARSTACFEESLELYRSLGNKYGEAYVLMNHGEAAIRMGDLERAKALATESLTLFGEVGDRRCVAFVVIQLGDIAREQGNYEQARAHYQESLRLNSELHIRSAIVLCLERMARLACALDQGERAARLHGAAMAFREAMGSAMAPADRPTHDRDMADVRERMGDEAFAAEFSTGHAMTLEQAVTYALEEETALGTP